MSLGNSSILSAVNSSGEKRLEDQHGEQQPDKNGPNFVSSLTAHRRGQGRKENKGTKDTKSRFHGGCSDSGRGHTPPPVDQRRATGTAHRTEHGILDREQRPLALSRQVTSFYAVPSEVENPAKTARTLARDAPLLILDEPSSNLDARAESELLESLAELARNRSTLLISHRFSTVGMADRIAVMHEGSLVEIGTHQELLAAKGRYARLLELNERHRLPPALEAPGE